MVNASDGKPPYQGLEYAFLELTECRRSDGALPFSTVPLIVRTYITGLIDVWSAIPPRRPEGQITSII